MSVAAGIMIILTGILGMPETLFAGAAQASADPGDTAWMMMCTAMVLFMVPGLALFYAGMVRSKNVLSTLMHSFAAIGIITIQWFVIGYSLSFGKDVGHFIGSLEYMFLNGVDMDSLSGTIPTYIFFLFQGMFAIITPAIISGAIAERIKFSTYVVFILLWSTFIYDPIAHWVWGEGGWLLEMGALDFAGGTVVHISSGLSALAFVIVAGSRVGFPREKITPHNLTMTCLGAGMLLFGWFGFNAGSALSAGSSAANAFLATHLAAAGGAVAWMLMEWKAMGKASALGLVSGIVAGLVGITPAAGFVKPGWALVIGLVAGVVCYYGILLKVKLRYDDSLDAFGIHGIGGMWGALATGLFATIGAESLITGNLTQVLVQLLSIIATAAYAFFGTFAIVMILKHTMGLRVEKETEIEGLDKAIHGEIGYNL